MVKGGASSTDDVGMDTQATNSASGTHGGDDDNVEGTEADNDGLGASARDNDGVGAGASENFIGMDTHDGEGVHVGVNRERHLR